LKDKILVVGGYGNVGQTICRDLGEKFPGKIIAAGRSYKKAEQFSLLTNGNVIPKEFDVLNNRKWNEVLNDVFIVVMCLDQEDTRFVEICIKKGIHYIDITASYKFLSQVEVLNLRAKKSGVTVVLGVGLSPGLSNLLVKYSKSNFDSIERAEIFIMLGLGDKHGRAAIEWTVDNINSVFSVLEENSYKPVKSFEDGKKTLFPGSLGTRTAYRFDFVDQHVIPKTLGVKSSSTYLCFDSAFITNTFALLKKMGLFNLLKMTWFRNTMIGMFEKVHLGSDLYVLKVVTEGIKQQKKAVYHCSVKGNKEGEATGKVTPIVAEHLYTGKLPAGVFYLEELFELEEFLERLINFMEFSQGEFTEE
jgi:saccharopine dehydrogenase (NAD+, L-lysine forming)